MTFDPIAASRIKRRPYWTLYVRGVYQQRMPNRTTALRIAAQGRWNGEAEAVAPNQLPKHKEDSGAIYDNNGNRVGAFHVQRDLAMGGQ